MQNLKISNIWWIFDIYPKASGASVLSCSIEAYWNNQSHECMYIVCNSMVLSLFSYEHSQESGRGMYMLCICMHIHKYLFICVLRYVYK